MNLMVTTNQIPTYNTQKIKRKEHKHNIEKNHHTARRDLEKEKQNRDELQK